MADTGKNLLVVGLLGGAAYLIYEWWKGQQTVALQTVATPGTTATMQQAGQPTNISTTASSTPSTTPTATAAQPATVVQPTATDLQKQINMTLATADQWNYAYRQLVGYGIEQVYNASFDGIYGAVQSDGTRSSGQITANAFLSMPTSSGYHAGTVGGTAGFGAVPYYFRPVSSLRGLGAIANYYTPVVSPIGSMVYRSQHPSPYRFPQTVPSGVGAFTQPTGFETALYAGLPLRSNRIL